MRIAKTISLALVFSVAVLLFTAIPSAASEVPADKYTYTLSGKVGAQSQTVEFEGSNGAQEFEVILVGASAEVKFTPKEKMSASVRAYDPDGYYAGTVMWTIDGSEEAVTEIEANKTATATLVSVFWGCPNPYYIFTFGDGNNTTQIVYKSSADTAVPTPEPTEESVPAEAPVPETASESESAEAPAPAAETAPAPAPAATASAPKVNTTYKVQQGDTLGTIALNNYGSYKYYTKIYNANKELLKKNKDRLSEGMELVLPAEGLLSALNAQNGNVYTVKAGDTLGKIAAKHYGSASKYTKIYEANKDRIKNPNMIFIGQKIVIPN